MLFAPRLDQSPEIVWDVNMNYVTVNNNLYILILQVVTGRTINIQTLQSTVHEY